MSAWIIGAAIVTSILGVSTFIGWVIGSIAESIAESALNKRFEKDIENAIVHSQPTWSEIKLIAQTNAVSSANIYFSLKRIMASALTGKNERLLAHKSLIQDYLNEREREEPFEGLPSDIRIHLEKINENLGEKIGLLDPLTNHIRNLLAVNRAENRKQKFYTAGGFFVGLIGLCFAVYSSYFAPIRTEAPPQIDDGLCIEEPAANNQINQG